MCAKFSDSVKDHFIAPFLSQFTEADIPDMSTHCDQSKYWLSNYFLNSLLSGKYKDPYRQYAFSFLRRLEAAFRQYELARNATYDFLDGTRQSPSQYMRAIMYWEYWFFEAYHSFNILRYFADIDKVFESGDDSVYDRLNRLYNKSKHVESFAMAPT